MPSSDDGAAHDPNLVHVPELVSQAQALAQRANQRPAIIGIDGRSGAGKTTLALQLATDVAPEITGQVRVVHLEDFYPGWEGLAEGVRTVANQILAPLRLGLAGRARSWDWYAMAPGDTRQMSPGPGIVLVEGCGAGSAAMLGVLDAVAWLEMGAAPRRRRVEEREDSVDAWWQTWAAQEDQLLDQWPTNERADWIIHL